MRKILVITGLIVLLTLIVMLSMVKFVTEIKEIDENAVPHVSRPDDEFVLESSMEFKFPMSEWRQNRNRQSSERFPYMVAIIAHKHKGFFSCFGCFIQTEWVLTAAHCKRPEQSHRVLLYSDYVKNLTHAYPVVLWRVNAENDIAVAKIDLMGASNVVSRVAGLPKQQQQKSIKKVMIAKWNTVYTSDNTTYLTKDMWWSYVSYGVNVHLSTQVYLRMHVTHCFMLEFGPLFAMLPKPDDWIFGLLRTCEGGTATITNVVLHRDWILKATES